MIMNTSALRQLFEYGYVFEPTEEEILEYLYNKVVGQHDVIDSYTLPEINLYNQQPSDIWQQLEGIDGQDIYVFTQLNKKKSRIIRKVGSHGHTWSGENKPTSIYSSDHRKVIGTVKRFHYENSKLKTNDEEFSWIMQEYTLHPSSVPTGIVHDSYVVCKLRKKVQKKRKKMDEESLVYDRVAKRINRIQKEQFCKDHLNDDISTCISSLKINDSQLQINSSPQIEPSSQIDVNHEETIGSDQFCIAYEEPYFKDDITACILPKTNNLQPQLCSTPQNESCTQIINQEETIGSDQYCIAYEEPYFKDDITACNLSKTNNLQPRLSSTPQNESCGQIIIQEETIGSDQFCIAEPFLKDDITTCIASKINDLQLQPNQEENTESDQFCIADAGPFLNDGLNSIFADIYETTSTKQFDEVGSFLNWR